MLSLMHLSWKSLRNRIGTVSLTILSIALSFALLLGVERIRKETRNGFTNTVSGTDLIVGARTGSIQLLLSSVFRIGDASNNMDWESVQMLAGNPAVDWTIPVSLGDSHRGFRVLGTTGAYYDHFQYGRQQPLQLQEGAWFSKDNEAVIGAEVAAKSGYQIGDSLVVAHGAGDISFIEHDQHPFRIVGILERTGTPVDRTVHVDLTGITAIHAGMETSSCGHEHDPLHSCAHDHGTGMPSITAVFVGLKSRSAVLSLQRMVNEYEGEALSAILPALVLQELWGIMGVLENVLLAISFFVIAVGLTGMMVVLMAGLNERRREMAILRSVGARPYHIFSLIAFESILISLGGVLSGFLLIQFMVLALRPTISKHLGLLFSMGAPTGEEVLLGLLILGAGLTAGLLPAYRSFRFSLADGLTMKI